MRLRDALKQKFSTPQEAMKALGLDESLIETERSHKEQTTMSKILLSRKAAVAKGALLAYLAPKMAQDAKIDLNPILAKVSVTHFPKAAIAADIRNALTGKLAKDAKLDDIGLALDAAEKEETAEDAETEANGGIPMVGGGKEKAEDKRARDWLKDKLSKDDMEAYDKMCKAEDSEEDDEEKRARDKRAKDKAARDAKRAKDGEKDDEVDEEENDKGAKDMVTKGAMDAAVKAAVKIATDSAIQTQREIREAEEAVRPHVGKLIAMDSAEEVYRAALKAKGVDAGGIKEIAALKLLVAQLPLPNARETHVRDAKIAMDSTALGSFNALFGNPKPVQHV